MNKRITIFLVLIAFVLSGCSFTLAQDITPPPGLTQAATLPPAPTTAVYPLLPPSPSAGGLAYQSECASCHGEEGLGDGERAVSLPQPPTRLKNPELAKNTSLSGWFDLINNHASGTVMPDFSTILDARTRWDIAAHLYMLNTNSNEIEIGRQLYENNCLQCHGVEGKGDGTQASGLSLSPSDFSFQRILTARTNADLAAVVSSGAGNVMPAYKELFSQAEIDAVVSYIRIFSFAENPYSLSVEKEPATTSRETPTNDNSVVVTPEAKPQFITVTGRVIHDSKTIPAGQEVTLRVFDNMEESDSLQTKTTADGTYLFEKVPMNDNRILIVTTTYGGQTFNSDPSRHPASGTSESQDTGTDLVLDIHVSDATTDTATLSVERLHIFFDFSHPDVVQIVELFLISNQGEQTVVPVDANSGVLNFALPTGATNLQFQDSVIGQRYLATDTGFTDTAPVPPGSMSSQVLFAFDLPYDGRTDISLPIPYRTDSVIVMAPLTGIKFSSDQLIDGGVKSAAENTFRVHTGSNLSAGSQLSFQLSGQPESNTAQAGGLKFNSAWIGGSVLVLVVFATLFYLYQKKIAKRNPSETIPTGASTESILDSIIALDSQFKAGHISEAAYLQRRQELKDQLKKTT